MLESIWFLLWGILWAVYFMLGGFDLGVGILSPFVGKSEAEKSALLGSIGPFWDGNEVWLITAGGVTFAAFPAAYATLFSAFYTPLMFVLFGLIIRAVSIEFRKQTGVLVVAGPRRCRGPRRQLPARPALRGGLCEHLQRDTHRRRRGLSREPAHPPQPLRPCGGPLLSRPLSRSRSLMDHPQIDGRHAGAVARPCPVPVVPSHPARGDLSRPHRPLHEALG